MVLSVACRGYVLCEDEDDDDEEDDDDDDDNDDDDDDDDDDADDADDDSYDDDDYDGDDGDDGDDYDADDGDYDDDDGDDDDDDLPCLAPMSLRVFLLLIASNVSSKSVTRSCFVGWGTILVADELTLFWGYPPIHKVGSITLSLISH